MTAKAQSKGQYTEGPWRVDKLWALVRGPNDEEICAIHAGGDDGGTRQPVKVALCNANLIAAAPELAEALANAVRCGERDGMPGNPGSAPRWVIKARAALDKAGVR